MFRTCLVLIFIWLNLNYHGRVCKCLWVTYLLSLPLSLHPHPSVNEITYFIWILRDYEKRTVSSCWGLFREFHLLLRNALLTETGWWEVQHILSKVQCPSCQLIHETRLSHLMASLFNGPVAASCPKQLLALHTPSCASQRGLTQGLLEQFSYYDQTRTFSNQPVREVI